MNPVTLWRSLDRVENHTFMTHRLRAGAAVIDAGANVGGFCTALARRYGATVFAFEPDPRVRSVIPATAGVEIIPDAVAASAGSRRFDCNAIPQGGRLGVETADSIDVRTVNLEAFAGERGLREIALIKLDIEGTESEVLHAFSEAFLETVDQVTVEFHDFCQYLSVEEVRKVVARLDSLGFACVKFSASSYGDTLFINRRRCGYGRLDDWLLRYGVRNITGAARIARRWLGAA